MRPLAIFAGVLVVLAGCAAEGPGGDPAFSDDERARFLERQELLLARLSLDEYVAERDGLDRSAGHDRYFNPVGLIRLSNDVVIGMITSLDLSEDGNILIADRTAGEVFLFAPDGRFVRRLDPTACDPGLAFIPFSAGFTPEGGIMVQNGTRPNVVEFDATGSCTGIHDVPVNAFGGIVRGGDGRLYALNNNPASWHILAFGSGGAADTLLSGPDFSQYNARMGGLTNSLIATTQGRLVFMQRQDALVTLIDPASGSNRKIGGAPADYRPIEDDLTPGLRGTERILKDIRRISEGKSMTIGIDEVAEHVIAVTYKNSWEDNQASIRSTGMQFVHTSGEVLNTEPIHFRLYLSGTLAGRDGVIIREGSRYEEPNLGMDDNRPLIVYRLRLPDNSS